jgi:Flp pilus assembly pilin Flp
MRPLLRNLWHDKSGQDMIEYALVAALVATGSAVLMPMTVSTGVGHIMSRVIVVLERFGNGNG